MSSLSVILTGAAREAADRHVPDLVAEKFASRLFAKDHTLWGPAAEDEASKRLGWVDTAEASRQLVPQINELREAFAAEGVDRFVLAGMGGSSLAPEVVTKTAGVELFVLDSTDPVMVQAALSQDIARTAAIISSKSGSTVETDSARRAFEKAFNDAGIDAARRMVVVTDPGSPFDQSSREAGYRAVFTADPTVGGRFSAMTAFGLVPSGLAGVNLDTLLDEVDEAAEVLREDDSDNLGLLLGAAMGGTSPLRDKLLIQDVGSGIVGFADWAEQLIAESTGKDGTGVLPVVVAVDVPELEEPLASDVLPAFLIPPETDTFSAEDAVAVAGSLGGQMLLWEVATSVAGRLLGINPFDQPDVESAKSATRAVLENKPEPTPAVLTDGSVEIRGGTELLGGAQNLTAAVEALLEQLPADGYVAIQAYFDRLTWTELEASRPLLAEITRRPATFGWGPRFLHSTGQFHKGGPGVGVFLQITADSDTDLEIPGIPFTFGELISAQADGDAQVLEEHDRPVLRLRLTDRETGVSQILDVLHALAQR
ncbi:glucose-6-phosphate isomerase [Kocuria coralli]|uniref:Glucose-6-phosphate isomerase n=1 Tax=Kocuria coralli TaxID=1461025 RepID=A0A5J5L041_9MICC|nr:glucose-6-phosphate isomerase [Kocuria coralli]KAA9394980.1 glucose-6-phosphate isomerase [Kocuria coralli]